MWPFSIFKEVKELRAENQRLKEQNTEFKQVNDALLFEQQMQRVTIFHFQ